MIEIFETCQTKSIAKQTNRDESLIIRSIVCTVYTVCTYCISVRVTSAPSYKKICTHLISYLHYSIKYPFYILEHNLLLAIKSKYEKLSNEYNRSMNIRRIFLRVFLQSFFLLIKFSILINKFRHMSMCMYITILPCI